MIKNLPLLPVSSTETAFLSIITNALIRKVPLYPLGISAFTPEDDIKILGDKIRVLDNGTNDLDVGVFLVAANNNPQGQSQSYTIFIIRRETNIFDVWVFWRY